MPQNNNRTIPALIAVFLMTAAVASADGLDIATSTPIEIQTYVKDNNELVHPYVYDFKTKWNRYRYWMIYTAYPGSDSKFENPSIAVSNNATDWTCPEGLVNPIAPETREEGFNSDATLFYNSRKNALTAVYRECGLRNAKRAQRLVTIESVDGITWTSPTVILEQEHGDIASPCLVETTGSPVLLTNDIANNTSNSMLTMRQCTTASPTGPFSEPTCVQIPGTPPDWKFWHFEVRKHNGLYYMLYMICPKNNSGLPGKLFLTTSENLSNWSNPIPVGADTGLSFYKSSFIIAGQTMRLWFSHYQNNTWKLNTTRIPLRTPVIADAAKR